MSAVNVMVSDKIKIPMNNTINRLELLLKDHPKFSEDTMKRFKKCWEDSIVDKVYPMKERMDIVENNDSTDVTIEARSVIASSRKLPIAKTKRRRRGTFSKFYSKPNERSLRLIRKRKQEALKEEQENFSLSESKEKEKKNEEEKTIERQRLLEMSGLSQVTVSISTSNATSADLEPGEEISTNIGMDLLGGDMDALADLQISDADIDLLEEEEEDDSELFLKEIYEGSNVMITQVIEWCCECKWTDIFDR